MHLCTPAQLKLMQTETETLLLLQPGKRELVGAPPPDRTSPVLISHLMVKLASLTTFF